MSDTLERIKAQIGMDPEVAIRERKQAAYMVATIKEKLAEFWGVYRGGTASPYDQQRKLQLSKISKRYRDECKANGTKVTERELEEYAHAHEDYETFLDESTVQIKTMYSLEAELAKAEADVAEWDRLLELVRSMIYWNSNEMKLL